MPRKKGVEKVATIVRLTPEAKSLLEQLAAKRGMPANIYVETFVRAQAEAEGVKALRQESPASRAAASANSDLRSHD